MEIDSIQRFHDSNSEDGLSKGMDSNIAFAFNDASFYLSLWKENGCRYVEIASVRIYSLSVYNYLGIQTFYRVKFVDGKTSIRAGPQHRYRSNKLFGGSNIRMLVTKFVLKENEFLTGIRVGLCYRNNICSIIFVTNHREVTSGSRAMTERELTHQRSKKVLSEEPASKIVAFGGIIMYGGLFRIGYIAEAFAWETIGAHICLRKLVVRGRATAKRFTMGGTPRPNADVVVQRWIATLNEDIFRYTLKFLIPTRGSRTSAVKL